MLFAPMGTQKRESSRPKPFIDVGERLRLTREAAGFDTAWGFAHKIGISNSTWKRYENGETPIKPAAVDLLKQELGIDYNWIFRGDLRHVPYELALKLKKLMDQEEESQRRRG